ncbi:MAG: DUF4271 domain-containing protein [Cyclobacteriaceae bacterium]|nr:DUF4271 domain-containing protein [Cyclobacteriaceae bacterium]
MTITSFKAHSYQSFKYLDEKGRDLDAESLGGKVSGFQIDLSDLKLLKSDTLFLKVPLETSVSINGHIYKSFTEETSFKIPALYRGQLIQKLYFYHTQQMIPEEVELQLLKSKALISSESNALNLPIPKEFGLFDDFILLTILFLVGSLAIAKSTMSSPLLLWLNDLIRFKVEDRFSGSSVGRGMDVSFIAQILLLSIITSFLHLPFTHFFIIDSPLFGVLHDSHALLLSYLTGVIIVFILLFFKKVFVNLIANAFGISVISHFHTAFFISFFSLCFWVLGIVMIVYYLFNSPLSQIIFFFEQTIPYFLLLISVVFYLILYTKLRPTLSFRSVYIICYLCASEIIPFFGVYYLIFK